MVDEAKKADLRVKCSLIGVGLSSILLRNLAKDTLVHYTTARMMQSPRVVP